MFRRVMVALAAVAIVLLAAGPQASASPPRPPLPAAVHVPQHATPGPAVHSFTVRINPKTTTTTGGVSAQAVVVTGFCTVYPAAVRDGWAVFAEAVAFCSEPFIGYHVTYGFYNYGRLYATGADFGYVETGYWTSATEAAGGTFYHRSVLECISVADNRGGVGYGCAWAAVNI